MLAMEASPAPTTTKHVAVFVFPFSSHPSPLLALTRRLSAASPPTTAFSFFGTEKSISAILPKPDTNFPNIRPFTVHDGLPDGYVPVHDPKKVGVPLELVDRFLKAAPESFRAATAAAEAVVGCKIGCMVSDAFVWMVGDLAAEMGVPWVVVRTGGPRSLVAHMNTDLIRTTIGIDSGYKGRAIDFIPGFPTTRCDDLPDGIVFGDLESPFARMLHKMGQVLHRANAVVINSFEEADPIVTEYFHSKFQKCLHVGPFILASPPPLKDEYGCISWLDEQDRHSIVYVSFGTMIVPSPSELAAIAEALLETGYPFLWSIKGNLEEKFPGDFLEKAKEKGKFVPWAPQLAVLRHNSVGVFVTHCGWNSLVESVIGGVPMIGRPFLGDQPENRATMEDEWGIGAGIEGGSFTKDGTVKALRMIMSQEQGKRMRERVGVLKEAALRSMEPNGSSTRNFNSLLQIINE